MKSYQTTFSVKRLWTFLALSLIVMFCVLLLIGKEIYQVAPPIPNSVQTTSGQTLFTKEDIQKGQNIWQSMGGMQQGSIWGHGSYVAPDWSADWLQREATALLSGISSAMPLPALSPDIAEQTQRAELRKEMRSNTYDSKNGNITISQRRATAVGIVAEHYDKLFQGAGDAALKLRQDYAMPLNALL